MQKMRLAKSIAIFLGCCLTAAAAFACLYHYDNKYTAPATVTQDGATLLSRDLLESGIPICLVEGWELYPDELLTSDQLKQGDHTPIQTFIGEFLSLSALHGDGSPYGRATYRLRYGYEGKPAVYSLLLPEIFCAAEVYQNGSLIAKNGSLYPYAPRVSDITASITLGGSGDIIVHTANFSHYYSGMTYPPIIASPNALSRIVGARMLIYGFLCFSSLAIALFSSAVWLSGSRKEDHLLILFGVLALAFSVRICYPFLRLFGVPLLGSLYALEDSASVLALYCALGIVLRLVHLETTPWADVLSRLTLGMLAVVALIPLFVLPALPAYTSVYGLLISWYKLLSALLLTALAFYGAAHGAIHSPWLLGGVAVYGSGLLAATVMVDRFEPLRGARLDEYGAFGIVLCFAVLMVLRSRAIVAENCRLTIDLRDQVEQRTGEITALIDERQNLFSELLHDIKSPMASVLTYTRLIRENGILLDDVTLEQLKVIDEKCGDVSDRLRMVQDFAAHNQLEMHFECIDIYSLLEDFYLRNRPDVEASGPDLLFQSPLSCGSCFVRGDREKLDRMLQNLVYNSVSFTPLGGSISLLLDRADDTVVIAVRDTGCGIAPEVLSMLFERFYTSRSDDGGRGLGLYIVKSIVSEHSGRISVKSEVNHGSEFTIFLPISK